MPIELAGETVAPREIGELALMLVTLGDDAQQAVRAHRLAVGAGEPAAGILDPKSGVRRWIGADAILDLIGDAVTFVALVRLRDDVEARLRVFRLEELREGAAGYDGARSLISSTSATLPPQDSTSLSRRHS